MSDGNDRALVYAFLCGFVEYERDNLPVQRYLDNPIEEFEARSCLANILRGEENLSRDIRNILAALFDPEPNKHPAVERILKFKKRGPGRTNNAMAKTIIAEFVWKSVASGTAVETAIFDAGEKYGKERSWIFEIWTAYEPLLRLISEIESGQSR